MQLAGTRAVLWQNSHQPAPAADTAQQDGFVTPLNLCSLLPALLLVPCTVCAAELPAEAPATPALMAAMDAIAPMVRLSTAAHARPASAGVAASLPEQPHAQQSAWRVPLLGSASAYGHEAMDTVTLPDGPGVSTLEASPLAGAARRVGARRFNTDDGSSVDDFAICYRLNGRSSVQVIPGDPAPVKLPVSSMSNNTGVTVGLVVRLFRAQ